MLCRLCVFAGKSRELKDAAVMPFFWVVPLKTGLSHQFNPFRSILIPREKLRRCTQAAIYNLNSLNMVFNPVCSQLVPIFCLSSLDVVVLLKMLYLVTGGYSDDFVQLHLNGAMRSLDKAI